ncbi:putative dehydrogenase [Prosthecobacter fusiformis]|uniref:Putative dehydrogenase n=1 Tax=Prosthecobacter fusiformis TaxID=48464 RepID=A0A4R7RXP4_9BACT|nr:Gfo/Idh/MocA family oxidoreductase [Prosthecobacter fusiformis]TDU69327.1 putative dehydrogenase [Prosthecobacter fusiformis]
MSTTPSSSPKPSGLTKFMDRRSFLRTSAVSGAGLYLATSKGAIAQGSEAGRTVKCALVGCGAQGDRLRVAASKIMTGIQWVAVCDIWKYNRNPVARRMEYENKHQVEGPVTQYETIEEMLEKQPDIEAVFIATPDHLHAPFSRMCLEKGKSVYCEKMMSNTIEGARDMVKAGRDNNGIFQIGHQRHSNPRYMHLRDKIVKNDLLGRVTHCYGQWNRGVAASQPLGIPKNQTIPTEMLAKYGFGSMEEFRNWRWFAKYGGGPISDLGAHQIDMFNWMYETTPVSLYAAGGVDYYDGTAGPDGAPKAKFELPDNVMCLYEYKLPTGTMRAYYQVLTTTGSQGYYEKHMGVNGSAIISESPTYNQVYAEPGQDWTQWTTGDNPLLVKSPDAVKNKFWEHNRSWAKPAPKSYAVSGVAKAVADARESKALDPWEIPVILEVYPHTPHVANFIESVQRKDPAHLTCNVMDAFKSCVTVLKAYECLKTGQKYMFTPEDFTV